VFHHRFWWLTWWASWNRHKQNKWPILAKPSMLWLWKWYQSIARWISVLDRAFQHNRTWVIAISVGQAAFATTHRYIICSCLSVCPSVDSAAAERRALACWNFQGALGKGRECAANKRRPIGQLKNFGAFYWAGWAWFGLNERPILGEPEQVWPPWKWHQSIALSFSRPDRNRICLFFAEKSLSTAAHKLPRFFEK
jgi:hypothetical protein